MGNSPLKNALGITITLAIAGLILALYACLPNVEPEAATSEQLYQNVPLDAHLLALDKQALDKAYEQHLLLLFSVWLRDDVTVVHRINNGLRNARRAYGDAAAKIEEREKKVLKP